MSGRPGQRDFKETEWIMGGRRATGGDDDRGPRLRPQAQPGAVDGWVRWR